MQYALLIYADPSATPAEGSPEQLAQREAWMSYTQDLMDAGVHRGGAALHAVTSATTVRERDGERLVHDGPFAETKEILGGFYLVDVEDLDAALGWAAKMPNISYGTVEVRPQMVLDRM